LSIRNGSSWALGAALGAVLVLALASKQVDPAVRLRVHPLDLTHPTAVLTNTQGIGPSQLGYFAWRGASPIGFRFGNLHAFDLVKLKLLAG